MRAMPSCKLVTLEFQIEMRYHGFYCHILPECSLFKSFISKFLLLYFNRPLILLNLKTQSNWSMLHGYSSVFCSMSVQVDTLLKATFCWICSIIESSNIHIGTKFGTFLSLSL